MKKAPFHDLSMRERQIMEALHALGRASVNEVVERLPDAASYDSVRVTLGVLERKGQVMHERVGRRYIYSPARRPDGTRRQALGHLIRTFFEGSPRALVSTLLGEEAKALSDDELAAMAEEIETLRRKRRQEKEP